MVARQIAGPHRARRHRARQHRAERYQEAHDCGAITGLGSGIDRQARMGRPARPAGAETPAVRGEMPVCARNQFSGASFSAQGSLWMGVAEAPPSFLPPSRPMAREASRAGRPSRIPCCVQYEWNTRHEQHHLYHRPRRHRRGHPVLPRPRLGRLGRQAPGAKLEVSGAERDPRRSRRAKPHRADMSRLSPFLLQGAVP